MPPAATQLGTIVPSISVLFGPIPNVFPACHGLQTFLDLLSAASPWACPGYVDTLQNIAANCCGAGLGKCKPQIDALTCSCRDAHCADFNPAMSSSTKAPSAAPTAAPTSGQISPTAEPMVAFLAGLNESAIDAEAGAGTTAGLRTFLECKRLMSYMVDLGVCVPCSDGCGDAMGAYYGAGHVPLLGLVSHSEAGSVLKD
jgi:hypothetical protein